MVREILMATDFSSSAEAALRIAVEYALRFEARLHLLHVASGNEPSKRDELDRRADQISIIPRKAVLTTVVTGEPAEKILDHARRERVDLIVVGTHGRTGVTRALLGSVAERVSRQAPCPVLTVPLSIADTAVPEKAVPPSLRHCLVCSTPSGDLICAPCRARIRGEALEHKREEERRGHV